MKTLAFVFQRKGSSTMDREDFIYDIPAELGWFSSKEARELLKKAEEKGLVRVEEDEIEIKMDYKEVNIPLGFRPSKGFLEEEQEKTLFQRILDVILRANDVDKSTLMSKVNKKQEEMNIEVETALLLVAGELDLELPGYRPLIEETEKNLLASEQ